MPSAKAAALARAKGKGSGSFGASAAAVGVLAVAVVAAVGGSWLLPEPPRPPELDGASKRASAGADAEAALSLAEEAAEAADACTDADESCEAWAKQGQCEQNPAYMGPNCAKSCGTCGDGGRQRPAQSS